MIQKDLYSYITATFPDDLEPVSALSKSTKGNVLVKDERSLYNFDVITKKVYNNLKTPSSADALLVTSGIILLTEFKSGFKRKISKETLDYHKLTCPDDSTKICKDFADLLVSKGNLETAELLNSIKFKAIESYLTLEKKLLPLCMDFPNDKRARVIFCVVIDDYVDSMEDTLAELAHKSLVSNTLTVIKSSLSRFINLKTSDNRDYFYDEVKVLSPYEYTQYISQFTG